MIAELRYVIRLSLKELGTSGSAIAALALSIGLTSAMFSILYGSFWKSLPFPEAGRLVRIETPRSSSDGVDWKTVETWRESQSSLDAVVPWLAVGMIFRGDGRPAELRYGAYVASEFFDAVGAMPMVGRGLEAESEIVAAPLSVVLGYQLWMSRFGGDRGVIGELSISATSRRRSSG